MERCHICFSGNRIGGDYLKNGNKGKIILCILVICVAIGLMAYIVKSGQGESGNTESDFGDGRVLIQEEMDDFVNVDSIYGKIEYPSMFSDIITVVSNEKDGNGCLEFYGNLENGTYLLYTFEFTEEEAEAVGIVVDDQGKELYIHMELAPIPENLTDADLNTFHAVQETLNDVLTSLRK